jgi:hypothetical protein
VTEILSTLADRGGQTSQFWDDVATEILLAL